MRTPSPDSMRSRILWLALAVALPVVVWMFTPSGKLLIARPTAEPRPIAARGPLGDEEMATIALFESSKNSVVYISTRKQVMDFWTRNVFSVPQGTGTGFIWDDRDHVVTNYHVIANASEALVRLNDGRDYKASLVGASRDHDLAVLHIDVPSNHPPPLPLGNSRDLKVGQRVFAIGNPFGLDWTLTTGIVSALDRSLSEENNVTIEHLIQTDAAINPGNSGGPLLDSAGRLIGITTAIYSPSGAYAGVGFAVPVDIVNRIIPKLIASGRYERPELGVGIDEGWNQTITQHLDVAGVAVLRVDADSGAAAAGLRPARQDRFGNVTVGDIILAINDRPVTTPSELNSILDEYEVGDTVKVSVLRDGRQFSASIKLQGARRSN